MVDAVTPYKAAISKILAGGTSVVALYGPLLGGKIVNPGDALSQGIPVVEQLWVNLVDAAVVDGLGNNFALEPGEEFDIPAGDTLNVSVAATTTGHRFAAYALQPPVQFPPTPIANTFPPTGPTSVLITIPSYPYRQYRDDSDVRAFFDAYNTLAQQYLDWFNTANLPIYTVQSGDLLDLVAEGLYGRLRPVLSLADTPSFINGIIGQPNPIGGLPAIGQLVLIGPQDTVAVDDDLFKRIITWGFYKGDGRQFSINWLKRRVMRFLIGTDGTAPAIPDTYRISVTFGPGNQVNIEIINEVAEVIGGPVPGMLAFGVGQLAPIGTVQIGVDELTPFDKASDFKAAVDSGVLELPFQFVYSVTVN